MGLEFTTFKSIHRVEEDSRTWTSIYKDEADARYRLVTVNAGEDDIGQWAHKIAIRSVPL